MMLNKYIIKYIINILFNDFESMLLQKLKQTMAIDDKTKTNKRYFCSREQWLRTTIIDQELILERNGGQQNVKKKQNLKVNFFFLGRYFKR